MALFGSGRCALFLQLTCAWLACASVDDPVPTKECLGSYRISQGFMLHPSSLKDGAELLQTQRVKSSSVCMAHCCALRRCSLALVGGSDPEGLHCVLFDCTHGQKSVCTLLVREGYEVGVKLLLSENPIPAVDCTSPSKKGPCRALFSRWYFNATEKVCQEFTYGGCQPNLNNYESEEECQKACSKITEPFSNVVPLVSRSVLGLKECSRQCSADEFRCGDGCCVPFDQICDGKAHCLDESDLQHCKAAVVSKPQASSLSGEDKESCYAPAVTGKCRAAFPRWYYDPAQQACRSFIYGGCGGNKNNYVSEESCLAACSGKTGNWEKSDDGNKPDRQHQDDFRRHVSAISMVVLLAICVLILLGGVVYFIVKLAKTDHVVSYHRTHFGEDKETLINAA
ncbi:kunitz-type protease inhibitor 1-like isoform X2 [Hypanus sabinus]|uniref:kunitz-type protease inhibitor 1-like isoform X2 n=1 Tax=Hypanus sabinus TaxID=79690 RepID=UPI0028C4B46E|nr:kunitz-type protease inhibitor 1-like isoform X2 [Hypanus sabinus]